MYKPPFVYELLPLSFLHRSYDASAKVARARHFRDSPNEYGGGVCIRLRIIVAAKALIGLVRVGLVYRELRPDPNSTCTDWLASHILGLIQVITGF